jgi:hypothetical protein
MALITGSTSTYTLNGQKEDFHDVIYDISPTDTPVMTAAKRLKASSRLHQWQVDSLATAALNAQLEGNEATATTAASTTVLHNRTMISSKVVRVSRTADTVDKYGRARETARLVAKAGRELKRDIETALLGAQGSSVGSATVPRQAAGYRAMIVNYELSGTTATAGTVPAFTTDWGTCSDSTAGLFIEADLKNALALAWADGGNPDMIVSNSTAKARASAFTGASAYEGFSVSNGRTVQGALIAGVDVYVSDFGSHKWTLDRFIGATAVLCLDSEYMGIAWLDPIRVEDLAKVGDGTQKLVVCEWTGVLMNPDAHAQILGVSAT